MTIWGPLSLLLGQGDVLWAAFVFWAKMAFPGPSRCCGVKMTILGTMSLLLHQGGIFRAVSLFSREVSILRGPFSLHFQPRRHCSGIFFLVGSPCHCSRLSRWFFVRSCCFGLLRGFLFQQAARGWFCLRAKCGFGGTFQCLGARLKIDGH